MDDTVYVPDPKPWITLDSTPEAIVLRLVVIVAIGLVSLLLARAAWDFGGWLFGTYLPRRIRHWVAGPVQPDWMPSAWMCGQCLSTNRLTAERCTKCRTLRASGEMRFAAPDEAVDQTPPRIAVSAGSAVRLEHDPAAHVDRGTGHWKLRVNGQVMGSVAGADGVVRLLRAIDGADVIFFDPLGTGYNQYRRDDLTHAFEQSPLPLRVSCPDLVQA